MRNEGWDSQLSAYLKEAEQREFLWGTNDCALWCAGWVALCTGFDVRDDWKGYKTEKGAKLKLARRGFRNAGEAFDAYLTRKGAAKLQRGDIALHPDGYVGICNGRLSHFMSRTRGTILFPTLSCPHGWTV